MTQAFLYTLSLLAWCCICWPVLFSMRVVMHYLLWLVLSVRARCHMFIPELCCAFIKTVMVQGQGSYEENKDGQCRSPDPSHSNWCGSLVQKFWHSGLQWGKQLLLIAFTWEGRKPERHRSSCLQWKRRIYGLMEYTTCTANQKRVIGILGW